MLATAVSYLDSQHSLQVERWRRVSEFAHRWFYQPDMQALQIALAAARAHFYAQCLAVWLMVVGPSASGKTTLVIDALQTLPLAREVGELTPQTFLSGKMKAPSLLLEGGSDHIFLFKDFTSFLSKRKEDRTLLAAQLREIYDGRWSKDTGERGAQKWRGKVTVIAGATHAVEEFWALNRNLGERFVTVRWPEADPVQMARAARKQVGHEREIAVTLCSLVQEFFGTPLSTQIPSMPPELEGRIDTLAALTARCRNHVAKTEQGALLGTYPPESPTRLVKAFHSIMGAWADLMGREIVEGDYSLAVRVGFDSIPFRRWTVMRAIPHGWCCQLKEIQQAVQLPETTVATILSDLAAVRVLEYDVEGKFYQWDSEVTDWLRTLGFWHG